MPDKINPYIAGAPVLEQRMFFGREDVFSWIERSLSGKFVDHILVIHGQRRVGKTSVLKHLPNRLPKRYIPIFIDLQGRVNTTLPRFLWWLAREITRALDMDKPDRAAFEDDPDFFESSFLPTVEEALGDNILLLTFDEFDTLESTSAQEGLALPFMAILKRLMEYKKLNFIFSIGSSGRKLENMQAAYTNFFKQALYRKISFLGENDARDLITSPVKGVLSFDLDAVDRIYEITSGHPYFIQLICHELFSVSQKSNDWHISKADVDAVLDAVIERGTVNLKFVWDESSELEKWVLSALAQFDAGVDMEQLEDFLGKQKVRFIHQDLESAVLHLREKDVLASGNRFVIYLLKLWLTQNRSIEQVHEELARINPIVSRLLQVGHEYIDQGDFNKAIDAFSEALQAEEDNLEVRLGLSTAFMAREDYGRAAIEYDEILALYPDDVAAQSGYCDAYLALGDVRFAMGRLDEAEYAFQQVLKISPQHRDGRAHMASLFHHHAVSAISGNEKAALEQARRALEFTPKDAALQSVVSELEALVDGKQDIKDVLFSWGERVREQGNWQDALDLLSAYERMQGGDDDLAALLVELREKARTESLLSLKSQAERLQRLDAYDDAIFAYNQYLSLAPDDADAIPPIIQSLKEARKQALRDEGLADTKPIWKRPVVWVSFAVLAVFSALLLIPDSPLRLALAPPAPAQEIVERIVVATAVPTIAPTPTTAPLPYKWARVTSAQFLERDTVTALAIHPEDPDIIYAGTRNSGIYKTNDGGISWLPANNGITESYVKRILIDPDNPNNIYISTNSQAIFKTEDGGNSWRWLDTAIRWNPYNGVSFLFMNPSNPAHLVYTDGESIVESRDHGDTWTQIIIPFSNPALVAIDPVSDNLIAVDGHNWTSDTALIYISNKNRSSWELTHELIPTYSVDLSNLSYDQVRNIFLLDNGCDGLESHDGGLTWETSLRTRYGAFVGNNGTYWILESTRIRKDREGDFDKHSPLYTITNTAIDTLCIDVSNSNPDRVVVGGEGIWVTDDGGKNWKNRSNGLGAVRTLIGFDPNQKTIYLGQHIIRCTNLENTNAIKNFISYDLEENNYREIVKSPCGSYPTQPWEQAVCVPEENVYRDPNDPNIKYRGSNTGAFISIDGGGWQPINDGLHNVHIIYSMTVDPENGDLYAMTPYGIYRLEAK